MPPVLASSPSSLRLIPKPLTSASFAPYGTAITPPLPDNLNHGPPPLSALQPHNPAPVLANQNSALKYNPISPLDNNYPGHSPSGVPSSARMSLFVCFSRSLRPETTTSSLGLFDVCILERHPYTTQTFIPLNVAEKGLPQQKQSNEADNGLYLVIVAPSRMGETATANIPTDTVTITDPPDLSKIEAFVAHRGQAVTYGAGTWHAPMVVMGERRVDFVVAQFANGVGDEDCQEVEFGKGIEVEIKIESETGGDAKL